MKITIHRGSVHSVSIQSGFSGPMIDLDLSAALAYELLQGLDANRAEIKDLATNYYDCRECGETHHNSVSVCPALREREEGD